MSGGSGGSTPTSPKCFFHCAAPKAQEGSPSNEVGGVMVEMGLGCGVWIMEELLMVSGFELFVVVEMRLSCGVSMMEELLIVSDFELFVVVEVGSSCGV